MYYKKYISEMLAFGVYSKVALNHLTVTVNPLNLLVHGCKNVIY